MNTDIKKMIELQHLWNQVLDARNTVERAKKSILHWERNVAELSDDVKAIEKKLKSARADSDSSELELGDIEQKITNLNNRRTQLKTQREVEALDHELEKKKNEKDILEEKIINSMELIESLEKELSLKNSQLADTRAQADDDIEMLKQRIESAYEDEINKKSQFDEGINDISPEYRSRFLKLTGSEHGKAIVPIKGEICQGCNFQVPVSIVMELGENEKPVICTNCGRYIYISQ